MELRRPKTDDVPTIMEIANKYDFILPVNFDEAAVVTKNGKVVAFGIIRPILEALMISNGSPREIIESTKLLIEQAKKDARNLDYSEIHTFVEGNKTFERLLMEHEFREIPGKFFLMKLEE